MTEKDTFTQQGYTVFSTENKENKLLNFLKEHYPSVIRDNEINIEELKAVAGLPIDEKVNGYGLNFVGRNFARAKYAQKTKQALQLNTNLSKNIDTTKNLVLKGDNLDSLKILKNHYTGKIKCIYIDPPYNTTKDEFVYPDRFDKEEAEVLGLANLSEDDYDRMDFSFKSKKSHNGWLAFMYPRLLLARDLLSKDGVIFISIDDNEQANLKLLCDDVFGEENFVGLFIVNSSPSGIDYGHLAKTNDYALFYTKDSQFTSTNQIQDENKKFAYKDNIGGFNLYPLYNGNSAFNDKTRPNLVYPFYLNPNNNYEENFYEISLDKNEGWIEIYPVIGQKDGIQRVWRWGKPKAKKNLNKEIVGFKNSRGEFRIVQKSRLTTKVIRSLQLDNEVSSRRGTLEIEALFGKKVFSYPKPSALIERFAMVATNKNDIILDFFAGSGTTGQAVMQLNAEDGGNRKFILCQIDEPIKKDKPEYQFCIDNNLPPVISSITIERLKRAGEKIAQEAAEANSKSGMFVEHQQQVPDIGYKVFDSVAAPKLELQGGTIVFPELTDDALSRIYNMIFTIGLDEPTEVPEVVIENCMYKIGSNYYITNSKDISKDDLAEAIKNGKVYIDGWTASLNGTMQHYKDDVKIVF